MTKKQMTTYAGKLAFTHAKNATKPNPFEIIPLQTTRKENIWKTEEALARVAAPLETERIKGAQSLMFMMMMIMLTVVILIVLLLVVIENNEQCKFYVTNKNNM